MKLKSFGAVDGVTGSRHLLNIEGKKLLIDCGLFQGPEHEQDKNWNQFEFDPKTIDAVFITHSHIDHVGLLPKLYRDGFRGPVYATEATIEFSKIFLTDSQEILSKHANQIGRKMLYSMEDVKSLEKLYKPIEYHKPQNIFENIEFTLFDAGHILGSAFIKISSGGKSIVFSGDLGNPPVPIIKDTDFLSSDVDYLVLESTYGSRKHALSENRKGQLEDIIENAITKNGTLLIPAFAMERTQELLYELNELVTNNRIPKIPIYIDSPLAQEATKVYPKYERYFDNEARDMLKHDHNLFQFDGLKMIESVEESKMLDKDKSPKIIIAGSGMSTGGRIVFHEKVFLSDPKTTLLIIGYQVKGTLGRSLQEGKKHVSIMGHPVTVNAKVITINSYSAHADQPKLVFWTKKMEKSLNQIFLTHGEAEEKESLKTKIQDEIGTKTIISEYNKEYLL